MVVTVAVVIVWHCTVQCTVDTMYCTIVFEQTAEVGATAVQNKYYNSFHGGSRLGLYNNIII